MRCLTRPFQMREHTDLPRTDTRPGDAELERWACRARRSSCRRNSRGMARAVAWRRHRARSAPDAVRRALHRPRPISLGVIARLVRTLNDSLGQNLDRRQPRRRGVLRHRRLRLFRVAGRIVGEGKPEEMRRSASVRKAVVRGSPTADPVPLPRAGLPADLDGEADLSTPAAASPSMAERTLFAGLRSAREPRPHGQLEDLRLGFAARFFVYVLLKLGHRVPPLRADDPRDLLRGRALDDHHPGLRAVRGDGAGLAGYETLQRYVPRRRLASWSRCRCARARPVVAGLLFASRAGSAITAEIGLMKRPSRSPPWR